MPFGMLTPKIFAKQARLSGQMPSVGAALLSPIVALCKRRQRGAGDLRVGWGIHAAFGAVLTGFAGAR
jgi:hypothetical protein